MGLSRQDASPCHSSHPLFGRNRLQHRCCRNKWLQSRRTSEPKTVLCLDNSVNSLEHNPLLLWKRASKQSSRRDPEMLLRCFGRYHQSWNDLWRSSSTICDGG